MAIRIKHSELRRIIKEQLQRLLEATDDATEMKNIVELVAGELKKLYSDLGPDLQKDARTLGLFVSKWMVLANQLVKSLRNRDEDAENDMISEINGAFQKIEGEFAAIKKKLEGEGRKVDPKVWESHMQRFAKTKARAEKFVDRFVERTQFNSGVQSDDSTLRSAYENIVNMKATSDSFQELKEKVVDAISDINVLELNTTLKNEEAKLYLNIHKVLEMYNKFSTRRDTSPEIDLSGMQSTYDLIKGQIKSFYKNCLDAYNAKQAKENPKETILPALESLHAALSAENKKWIAHAL